MKGCVQIWIEFLCILIVLVVIFYGFTPVQSIGISLFGLGLAMWAAGPDR